MEEANVINAALDKLGLSYEHEQKTEDFEYYSVILDEEEDLVIDGVLYSQFEGKAGFRLMLYVDELDKKEPLDQLISLMALNGELVAGAFCMDPEEKVIYATICTPAAHIDAELLSWMMDSILIAQMVYYEKHYADAPENTRQGEA